MGRFIPDSSITLGGIAQAEVGTTQDNLPDTPGVKLVSIKALGGNAGMVYVGLSTAVSATTGWELDAGQETPWLPVNDLNEIWLEASEASQRVAYVWMK